jgi:hypothetical protein
MCYLLFKPKNQSISLQWLQNAYDNGNVDGCGLAYHTKRGGLVTIKTLSIEKFLKAAAAVPLDVDAIFHLRMASTGEVAPRNCHPFTFADLVGAHNGCLAGYGSKVMTDTEDFFMREVGTHAELVANRATLETQIGYGKMVFLSAGQAPVILNEKLGHWTEGCWHSNNYHNAGRWGAGFLGLDEIDETAEAQAYEDETAEALDNLQWCLQKANEVNLPRDLAKQVSRLLKDVEAHLYSQY